MGVRNFISTKYIGCRRDPISNLKSGEGSSFYPGAKSLYLLDYSTATFTRTSEAAYVDPRDGWSFVEGPGNDGTGSFLPANQPRIFSDGAILIEGSRTNKARMSPDMSQAHYAKVGTVLSQSVGPAGDVGYYLVDFESATGRIIDTTIQHTDYPSTGTMALSHYSKADAAKDYAFQYISSGSTVLHATTVSLDWSHRSYAATDFSVGLGIINATGSFETEPLGLYGLQAEEDAAFPSSFIRCFGTPATRAADNLYIPAAAVPEEMISGRFAFDFWPEFSSDELAAMEGGTLLRLFSFYSGNKRIIACRSNSGTAAVSFFNGSTWVNVGPLTWDAMDKITVVTDIPSKAFSVSINDTLQDTIAIEPQSVDGYSHLRIGSTGTADFCFGVISRPRRIKDA